MKANRDYLLQPEKLTATHKTKETIKRVESLPVRYSENRASDSI